MPLYLKCTREKEHIWITNEWLFSGSVILKMQTIVKRMKNLTSLGFVDIVDYEYQKGEM